MTYEYVCTSCQHEWEAEQSISADPLRQCPKCGKMEAKRQVSGGAGFILKGGGWYADGYGSSKGDKPSSSAETKPGSEPKGSDDKASKKSSDTAAVESDSKKAVSDKKGASA